MGLLSQGRLVPGLLLVLQMEFHQGQVQKRFSIQERQHLELDTFQVQIGMMQVLDLILLL